MKCMAEFCFGVGQDAFWTGKELLSLIDLLWYNNREICNLSAETCSFFCWYLVVKMPIFLATNPGHVNMKLGSYKHAEEQKYNRLNGICVFGTF